VELHKAGEGVERRGGARLPFLVDPHMGAVMDNVSRALVWSGGGTAAGMD